MGHITDALLNLHGPVIYGVVAALVFAEAALFFGFVFPGETAIVVAGVLASQHRVSMPVLLAVIVVAAIVGDSVGYEIGRRFGDRLLDIKAVSKHRTKVDRAHGLLRRRGAYAVFLGRFTALLRAMMPALAGSAKMPYGRFLAFNALGGVVWGVGFTTGGFLAGTAFEQVAQWAGRVLAIAVAAAAVVALAVWSVRRRRKEKAALAGGPARTDEPAAGGAVAPAGSVGEGDAPATVLSAPGPQAGDLPAKDGAAADPGGPAGEELPGDLGTLAHDGATADSGAEADLATARRPDARTDGTVEKGTAPRGEAPAGDGERPAGERSRLTGQNT